MNIFLIAAFAFTIVDVGAERPGCPRSEESNKFNADFKTNVAECKTEIGASDDDIERMMMISHESPSDKSWCVVGCIHKKTGVMDADNKFNMDKLKKENIPLKRQNPARFEKLMSNMQECKTEIESIPANLATQCTATKAMDECMKSKMF